MPTPWEASATPDAKPRSISRSSPALCCFFLSRLGSVRRHRAIPPQPSSCFSALLPVDLTFCSPRPARCYNAGSHSAIRISRPGDSTRSRTQAASSRCLVTHSFSNPTCGCTRRAGSGPRSTSVSPCSAPGRHGGFIPRQLHLTIKQTNRVPTPLTLLFWLASRHPALLFCWPPPIRSHRKSQSTHFFGSFRFPSTCSHSSSLLRATAGIAVRSSPSPAEFLRLLLVP